MAGGVTVGSVRELWRFPVKSMQGERLREAEITARGLVGDRAYALVDAATGELASAKRVRDFPDLLGCRAAFVEPPVAGRGTPALRIELRDGTVIRSDSDEIDRVLSAWFKREVRLVEQRSNRAPAPATGADPPRPADSFFDAFPVSVLTGSTLARLGELQPGSRFDARRFRMNLILDTGAPGFPENDWVGRQLGIGDTVRLGIEMHDARCVMTTLAQDDLPEDAEILRTLTRHNRLHVAGHGRLACAGVYGRVTEPGTIRAGDRVQVG